MGFKNADISTIFSEKMLIERNRAEWRRASKKNVSVRAALVKMHKKRVPAVEVFVQVAEFDFCAF